MREYIYYGIYGKYGIVKLIILSISNGERGIGPEFGWADLISLEKIEDTLSRNVIMFYVI